MENVVVRIKYLSRFIGIVVSVLVVCAMFYAMVLINPEHCRHIDRVPKIISSPGNYCLTKDLINNVPAASAIIIMSDNVSIDLTKHQLIATGIKESSSAGVEAFGHSNIVVKNGTIKNFMYGVRIQDTNLEKLKDNTSGVMQNIQVNNVVFESSKFRGVYIQAKNVQISHSKFFEIGGTTIFPDAYSIAIEVSGNSCEIKHNQIENVFPMGTGEGVAISLSTFGDGCNVHHNTMINNFRPTLDRTFGVWIGGGINQTINVTNNLISNFSYAANDREKVNFVDNQLAIIHCAKFYGKSRDYYLAKPFCLEEDTELFLKEAAKGDANALYKLGMQYNEGLWVDNDRAKSYLYFSLAAKKGHLEALRLKNKYEKPPTA